jgi:hypothetical protein
MDPACWHVAGERPCALGWPDTGRWFREPGEHEGDLAHRPVLGPVRAMNGVDLFRRQVRYPHAAGGLDNIATIISDLADRIDAGKLATLSEAYERSIRQRLGYLLDRFGQPSRAEDLYAALPQGPALPWIELERSQAVDPDLSPKRTERNDRWHVIVRRLPERDE